MQTRKLNNQNKVVVLDAGYDSYEYERTLLSKHGYSLDIFHGDHDDWAGRVDFANGAVAAFVRWTIVNDSFFLKLPDLKVVIRYGVGYDNIDLKAATQYGVRIANVQGYANHAVSDHALGLMYSCARSIHPGSQQIQNDFGTPPRPDIFEFHDKMLGIIGLGRIGGTLCLKARSLFQHVLAVDPYISNQRFGKLGAVKTDFETLLLDCHVISLHCNLTTETHHLLDEVAFHKMQKCPIIINTARGPVIDSSALLVALNDNIIHSAGLDVYETEPPGEDLHLLLQHPQVLGTGHYAWYSKSSSVALQQRAAQNMLALLQGRIPSDCLNPYEYNRHPIVG